MLERSHRNGLREGGWYAVMQGAGENYLSAYAVALHATPMQIGLMSAVPHLIGSWAQLLSVSLLGRISRRRLIALGTLGQALMWLPIMILPLVVPQYAV